MKDKLKGLLIGLLIGSMLTGSMAYAANSKAINVYFKQLKFMLDGVEKTSMSSSALIYDDKVYVPIRSVGEAIGKPVTYDSKNGTVWLGKVIKQEEPKTVADSVVAVYKGGKVMASELDAYLAFNAFYFGQPAPAEKQEALKRLISLKLLAAKAVNKDADAAKAVETEYAQILQYFGTKEALATQLKSTNLPDKDLKSYMKQNALVRYALEDMVGDAAIQAEYDKQRAADSAAFVTANVRHILIGTTNGETGEALRTEEEALARAKEVQAKLTAGGDFAELAKTYSDDPGSKDAGGLYENADLMQFVVEFKKASAEQPVGQVGDPVKTSYGYHVIKVDSRTQKTVADVKAQLLQGLLNQAYQNFSEKELPGLIESITLPKAP